MKQCAQNYWRFYEYDLNVSEVKLTISKAGEQ